MIIKMGKTVINKICFRKFIKGDEWVEHTFLCWLNNLRKVRK
jgi:hypothetical protein